MGHLEGQVSHNGQESTEDVFAKGVTRNSINYEFSPKPPVEVCVPHTAASRVASAAIAVANGADMITDVEVQEAATRAMSSAFAVLADMQAFSPSLRTTPSMAS